MQSFGPVFADSQMLTRMLPKHLVLPLVSAQVISLDWDRQLVAEEDALRLLDEARWGENSTLFQVRLIMS